MSKLDDFFKSYAEADEQLDFRMASDVTEKVPVISTGSLLLDEALSAGGFPKGRLIQLYGQAGSGKTLLAMIAIKNAQKAEPDAKQMFIDAEQTFSPIWAETLGLDTSKIIIVDGDLAVDGRRCFEMLLGVPKEDAKTHFLKGKSKEGLFDKIISKELNINLIVLDSLGAIVSPIESISQVGKQNMATLPRFLSNTLKKVSLETSKAKVPFIIINHKRATLDPYAGDHTFSGGNSYSHFLSANIWLEPVNRADAKILDENENKIGQTIRATVEKTKFGSWPRKCEFKVDFNVGIIDRHEEIGQLALTYEVVTKSSTVSHEYKDYKWVGANKYYDAIKNDPALAAELEQKIIEAREAKLDKKREEQKKLKEDSSQEESEKKTSKKGSK